MADAFEVKGLAELNKKLAALPAKIEKNILRSMVRAGAQVVRKAAVQNLENGQDSDITLKPSRRKSKGKIVFQVGPTQDKWYLKFQETGTAPHVIKGAFGFKNLTVQHPGHPAGPFLRPALDENVGEIIEAMRKQGEKRVEKEAAKR